MILKLKAKPGSNRTQLLRDASGGFVLKVAPPPVDGKANEAIIEFLSDALKISKSKIELKRGHTSAHKSFVIEGDEAAVLEKLNRYI